MNEVQAERYQAGNKGFEVIGGGYPLSTLMEMLDKEQWQLKTFEKNGCVDAGINHGNEVVIGMDSRQAASCKHITRKHNDSLDRIADEAKRLEAENAALRSQLPKVVTPHNAENTAWLAWWRCDCGDIVLFDAKYCQECGAKLDWAGVEK